MRIMMTLSYDGSNYCGWQTQKNGVTIQKTVESALSKLTGEDIAVTASGRTDAGVHALGQVIHFDTQSSVPPKNFYKALNGLLPSDIRAVNSKRVAEDFNARKTAKKKTYKYSFYYGKVDNPLQDRYAVRIEKKPNFEVVDSAICLLVGEHDYKAFSATGSSVNTTVRTVYHIKVEKHVKGFDIFVTGSGFLYNMVRIMVGALLDIGQGKLVLEDISSALTTGRRDRLGKTLPAKGLCLVSVEY